MPSAHSPNYDGDISPPQEGRIVGWLADRNALDTPVEFELLLDGQSLGPFRANLARPSLRRQGLGDGHYGFEIKVTDPPIGAQSRIAIRPLGAPLPVLQWAGGAAAAPPPDIASQIAIHSPEEVVRLIGGLTQGLLRHRVRSFFRTKDWAGMSGLAEDLLAEGALDADTLRMLGRGALYARHTATARVYLALAGALDPTSAEGLFFRGVTELRDRRFDEAVVFLRAAVTANPADPKMGAELCTALAAQMARQGGDAALAAEVVAQCRRLLDLDRSPNSLSAAGKSLLQAGHPAEALAIMEAARRDHPGHVEILHVQSRALVALGRVAEALELAEEVLRLSPQNQTAAFQTRTLADLAGSWPVPQPPTFGILDLSAIGTAELATVLAGRSEDWLALRPPLAAPAAWRNLWRPPPPGESVPPPPPALDPARLAPLVDPALGHQVLAMAEGPVALWRRPVLIALREAGLIGPRLEGLDRFRALYGAETPSPAPRRVLLMSGAGADPRLDRLAQDHQAQGDTPLLLDWGPSSARRQDRAGVRHVACDRSPGALLRLLIAEEVSLVHAVSGAGALATAAIAHTSIRLLCGIGDWREFLGRDGDPQGFDASGAPIPRPGFGAVLRRAQGVYVDAELTGRLLERAFGVRAPVVPPPEEDRRP